MGKVKANVISRDCYGNFKFWAKQFMVYAKDEKGNYLKDSKGENYQIMMPYAFISDLGIWADEHNGTVIVGGKEIDVFRDSVTKTITDEYGKEIKNTAILAAVDKFEKVYGVKLKVNGRKA